jgi:hypothetical protein
MAGCCSCRRTGWRSRSTQLEGALPVRAQIVVAPQLGHVVPGHRHPLGALDVAGHLPARPVRQPGLRRRVVRDSARIRARTRAGTCSRPAPRWCSTRPARPPAWYRSTHRSVAWSCPGRKGDMISACGERVRGPLTNAAALSTHTAIAFPDGDGDAAKLGNHVSLRDGQTEDGKLGVIGPELPIKTSPTAAMIMQKRALAEALTRSLFRWRPEHGQASHHRSHR